MPSDIRCYTPPCRFSATPTASGDEKSDSYSLSSVSGLEYQGTHTREKLSSSPIQVDTKLRTSLQKPDHHYLHASQDIPVPKDAIMTTIMTATTNANNQMSHAQKSKSSILSTGSSVLCERLSDARNEHIATPPASPSNSSPFKSVSSCLADTPQFLSDAAFDFLLKSTPFATHRRVPDSITDLTKPSFPTMVDKWELLFKESYTLLHGVPDSPSNPTYRLAGSIGTTKSTTKPPLMELNEPKESHSLVTSSNQPSTFQHHSNLMRPTDRNWSPAPSNSPLSFIETDVGARIKSWDLSFVWN